MQLFGERDEIDRLLRFAKRDHLHENTAMLIEEKIFGAKILDRGVQRVVVEKNGAENGALGIEVVWKRTFEIGISGHGTMTSLYLRPRYHADERGSSTSQNFISTSGFLRGLDRSPASHPTGEWIVHARLHRVN
jgi:hypothetical protein